MPRKQGLPLLLMCTYSIINQKNKCLKYMQLYIFHLCTFYESERESCLDVLTISMTLKIEVEK